MTAFTSTSTIWTRSFRPANRVAEDPPAEHCIDSIHSDPPTDELPGNKTLSIVWKVDRCAKSMPETKSRQAANIMPRRWSTARCSARFGSIE